jgi:hypothetical protein
MAERSSDKLPFDPDDHKEAGRRPIANPPCWFSSGPEYLERVMIRPILLHKFMLGAKQTLRCRVLLSVIAIGLVKLDKASGSFQRKLRADMMKILYDPID